MTVAVIIDVGEKQAETSSSRDFLVNFYAAVYVLLNYMRNLDKHEQGSLEAWFLKHPFLQSYFELITASMPDNLSWTDGVYWWKDEVERTETAQLEKSALAILRQQTKFNFQDRILLMLAGLIEEDSRFGSLFSELQMPMGYRRLSLESAGNIVLSSLRLDVSGPWNICHPMIDKGLLKAENIQAPRSEWLLTVPAELWNIIHDKAAPLTTLACRISNSKSAKSIDEVIVSDKLRNRLSALPHLFLNGEIDIAILRASIGTHLEEIAGAVTAELDKGVMVVDLNTEVDQKVPAIYGVLCTVLELIPVFAFDLSPGEAIAVPSLPGYAGPCIVLAGTEGGFKEDSLRKSVTLNVEMLSPSQRKQYWRGCIDNISPTVLDEVVSRYRLPGKFISQIATIAQSYQALDSRNSISMEDIQQAAKFLNRQMLDSLADCLEDGGDWGQLIVTQSTFSKLEELQLRCTFREQMGNHLGEAFSNTNNCGVRALFTGPSGTGKTLAAKIVAAELGMDIYRVDLASIINKYIGETEKNLHQVLCRAEALDVVLLLDEGDALLGARTEVKSSNDRYANLETNYLLQRLEHYQGIVIVTTNLCDNIDKAFQRRMDLIAPFYNPKAEQRKAIFSLHLPQSNNIDPDYLEQVARHCALTGGQIRNISLHAGLLAVSEDAQVNQNHIDRALRSDYRKNGATFPLETRTNRPASKDGGMQHFLQSIANN